MAKTCDYHNRDYMSYVRCGLDKNHDGDHAFLFKTHRQDIPHEHDWTKIVYNNYPYKSQRPERWMNPPDEEYRCRSCGRKRYEYR